MQIAQRETPTLPVYNFSHDLIQEFLEHISELMTVVLPHPQETQSNTDHSMPETVNLMYTALFYT